MGRQKQTSVGSSNPELLGGSQRNRDYDLTLSLSENTVLQEQVLCWWERGYNPIPFAFGKKHPLEYSGPQGILCRMKWRRFKILRLHHDPEKPLQAGGLLRVFQGVCNPAVVLMDNQVVIDCETREALYTCVEDMRQRGLRPFVVWSGSGRGGHIHLRIQEGAVESIPHNADHPQRDLPEIEILARGHAVLVDGAVHPDTGRFYALDLLNPAEPPTISLAAVDWLYNRHGEPVRLKLASGQRRHRRSSPERIARIQRIAAALSCGNDQRLWTLNQTTLDYLEHGHELQGTQTRNDRLTRAAFEFKGCGYAYAEAEAILGGIASQSGLGRSEVLMTLKSAYHSTRTVRSSRAYMQEKHPEARLADEASLDSALFAEAYAERHRWNARRADRKIFLAFIYRASLHNGVGFRASEREIAELARVSHLTAHRGIQRLIEAGLVETFTEQAADGTRRPRRDKVSGAYLWRFTDEVVSKGQAQLLKSNPLSTLQVDMEVSSGLLFNTSDASERGALGEHGLRLYRRLLHLTTQQGMVPLHQLVTETGLTRNQVNYSLKKLREVGLTVRGRGGYVGIAQTEEQIAVMMGTQGKGERRRTTHVRERALRAGKGVQRFRERHDQGYYEALDQAWERACPRSA